MRRIIVQGQSVASVSVRVASGAPAVLAFDRCPNPSIERTYSSWLRQLPSAAHVERWAPAVER
jgi:hypothetical protein